MDVREIQRRLNSNGFPCGAADGMAGPLTKQAIIRFQDAHAFHRIAIDGVAGPETQSALAQLPLLSPHFSAREVACRHCGCAYVRRELLEALEQLRAKAGKPIVIIDAYRCAAHNAEVGGVTDSQHQAGTAADLGTPVTVSAVKAMRLFSGIGNRGAQASHVDVRHILQETNPTPKATVYAPARWSYAT